MNVESAVIRFWSATLSDPVEETGFRAENAASLRLITLICMISVIIPNGIGAILDPLQALRAPSLWVTDMTRYAVIVVTTIALVRVLRNPDHACQDSWLEAMWLVMATDASISNLVDPQNVFDGFGGAVTLIDIIGFAGFSTVTVVDFRWTLLAVGGVTVTYAINALSGASADDALTRAAFAVVMVATPVIVLPVSHGLRCGARRSYLALRRERRLVSELEVARAAAEQATRVKSYFVATMSHEFRTPLNAILGMAELLAETRLERRQRLFVDLLSKAAEHLGGLVGDILDFSRIEADRIVLDTVPFDPGEIVQEVVELLGSEAQAKGLFLDAVLTGDTPRWCAGDRLRLRQVLLNLVSNALRYTPQGGVTVRMEPAAHTPDSRTPETLMVTVEDSGPGIPAVARASIFEPFVQADAIGSSGQGGLGLGLTISRRLVELMGGRLWLEDKDDGGSRFRFTVSLPVLERQPENVPQPGMDRAEDATTSALISRPRILLADDSEMNRLVIAEHLKTLPVTVEVTADGAAALARFETGGYAAVLLDIQMPVRDGRSAARAMRRLETERGWPPVPIIALTAGALWEERDAALAAGCTCFLSKPVKRRVLLQVLCEQVPGLRGALVPLDVDPPESSSSLVGRFLAELPAALARLHDAVRRDDRSELSREVHTLRGTALVVGLDALAGRLGALEAAAVAGRPVALGELEAAVDGLAEGWAARSPPASASSDPLPVPPAVRAEGVEAPPIRVLLAEDHALMREGIRGLLADDPRLEVVAEVGDGLACVRDTCRLKPEVAIIDLMMPQMAGAEAIAEIKRRRPEIKLLVLTAVTAPEPILAALRAGADGVLRKGAARTDLFAAIAAVRAGTLYLSPGLPLAVTGRDGAVLSTMVLSHRERQILKLLVEGRRNREIGDLLAISPKTVEKHRASLMKKVGVDSVAGLAGLALRCGLIEVASMEGVVSADTDTGDVRGDELVAVDREGTAA